MTGVDRDILISRVIDGEATPEDWAAFKASAQRDPTIWHDLATVQQDHAELSRAMSEAIAIADEVDLPLRAHYEHGLSQRFASVRAWGGWAAAAALLLAWGSGVPIGGGGGEQAGLAGSASDLLEQYLDRGQAENRVIREMPDKVLLDTRPMENGQGYEVIFVRQIMERMVIDDLYQYRTETDELGRERETRVRVAPGAGNPL